jgi:hypothetical protein
MHVWFQQLDSARTLAEVVAVARDYLATWNPREIALLPAAVRPGRVRDEQDIEILHGGLLEEFRDTKATGEALGELRRLTGFITHAVIRIAALRAMQASDEAGETPMGGALNPAAKNSLAPRG